MLSMLCKKKDLYKIVLLPYDKNSISHVLTLKLRVLLKENQIDLPY